MCDGHGQNGTQSSLLIKMKLANDVAEFIKIGKEQQIQKEGEPDPEDKE